MQLKESCLYVNDLAQIRHFYHDILELPVFSEVVGRHVFFRAGSVVFLCFNPEMTKNETTLPPHHANGKQHVAFEVPVEEYDNWKEKIKKADVKITYEHKWREGMFSFYFNDPEENVVEIVMEGLWG